MRNRKLHIETLESRDLMTATAIMAATALIVPSSRAADIAPMAATTRDAALWPFSTSSPWNTPLGSGAQYVAETSPGFNPNGGANLNVNDWSIPISFAKDTDPLVNVYWDTGLVGQFRIPAGAKPDPQADHSMAVISPDRTHVLEMWNAAWQGTTRINAGVAVSNNLTDGGVYTNYHGARAYGGSAIAGLMRKDELANLSIPHALAIAVSPEALNKNAPAGKPYVWPASHADGDTGSGYGTTGNLYMGSLLAISPSVDLKSLGLSPQGLAIAKALQDYGAYIVDTGGGNVIYYAEPGANVTTSANELGKLTPYLRVVSNNSAANVGGGGTRRADPAPSFSSGTPLPSQHSWQNPQNPLDVSGDGFITGLDALYVINELNKNTTGVLPAAPPPYLDVSGDDFVTPLDALLIIHALNAAAAQASQAGAGAAMLPAAQQEVVQDQTANVAMPRAASQVTDASQEQPSVSLLASYAIPRRTRAISR